MNISKVTPKGLGGVLCKVVPYKDDDHANIRLGIMPTDVRSLVAPRYVDPGAVVLVLGGFCYEEDQPIADRCVVLTPRGDVGWLYLHELETGG